MEKFYINPDGKYWGSVVDGDHLPFDGAIEVSHPPDTSASQTWNGTGWNAYVPVLTAEQKLDALFNSQKPEIRAQFFPLKAAVKLAIEQGDLEAAKYIIQLTGVPAELQAAKTQMLAVFNG